MARNANTVYWVGDDVDGSHQGNTTCRITLLLGNEVMVVPKVMIMENDHEFVQDMWDENMEALKEDGEGYSLRTVTDEEADTLYADRIQVEGEVRAEGHEAFEDGLDADDNPHDEDEDPENYWEWAEGWMAAYADKHGEEWDPEEDALQEEERDRADIAASKATMGRWFHEECAIS